jgi:thermitase
MDKSTRVALLLGALVLIAAGAAGAQQAVTDYYIVDGEKIELRESMLYEAVKVKPGSEGSVSAYAAADAGLTVQRSPILDRHSVILIKKNPASSLGAFRSSVSKLMSKSPAIESDVPVYAYGGIDQVLVNEFKIQFAGGVPIAAIEDLLKSAGAEVVSRDQPVPNRYVVRFPKLNSRSALGVVNGLSADKRVTFAEPNFIRLVPPPPRYPAPSQGMSSQGSTAGQTASLPDDPNFPDQWALLNTRRGGIGTLGADINAPAGWKITTGDPKVIIAIIDEGVDVNHPDLKHKIVTPFDAVDGDDDQQPNPWDAHGTACAGIAAAVTRNGVGVAGVSWGARIMPVRIAFSQQAHGPWQTDDIIIETGLRVAVARGAHVLSNSWGGGSPSAAINSAIDNAIAQNRIVVFAAGNAARAVDYPANIASTRTMLVVSATNEWDEFKTKKSRDMETWWGSNFGPEVWIAAPGVHISTTDISGTDGYDPTDYTATFSGTSSATPFVAGAAALLLSVQPNATPAQIRGWLKSGAKKLAGSNFDPRYGYGRLDIAGALTEATAVSGVAATN